MMENGYLLLGRSKFSGTNVDPGGARKQAEEIGAAVVLVATKYADSVTQTVPMTEYIPPREERYTESGYVQVSPDSGYWYDREMTRTIEGEFQTAYVPADHRLLRVRRHLLGEVQAARLRRAGARPSAEQRQSSRRTAACWCAR